MGLFPCRNAASVFLWLNFKIGPIPWFKIAFFFFDYNNKDFAAGSLISICAKQAQREIQMLFRVLKELKEQFHQPRL